MLREPMNYLKSRISTDKPLWHWAELFKYVLPEGPKGTDIDRVSFYKGHFLFVEAKAVGAPMSRAQSDVLEALAAQPQNSVLLVGLRRSMDDMFDPTWTVASWVWIGDRDWRNPENATVGGPAEFRDFMRGWHAKIDALEGERARKLH